MKEYCNKAMSKGERKLKAHDDLKEKESTLRKAVFSFFLFFFFLRYRIIMLAS
jgi:hypothetical protein